MLLLQTRPLSRGALVAQNSPLLPWGLLAASDSSSASPVAWLMALLFSLILGEYLGPCWLRLQISPEPPAQLVPLPLKE